VPALAVIVVSLVAHDARQELQALVGTRRSIKVLVAGLVVLAGTTFLSAPNFGRYFEAPFSTALYRALHPLDTGGLRVATTEAGLIPLALKNGRALDTYVHNTRSIAEKGPAALPDELREFDPNVLIVHGRTPTEFIGGARCEYASNLAGWGEQVDILYSHAAASGFQLILSERTGPCDSWNVFVNDEVPASIRNAMLHIPLFGERLVDGVDLP